MGKLNAVGFADKTNCAFYLGIVKGKDKCSILTECKCLTCTFGKTETELKKSRENAEQLLLSRGLKKVKKTKPDGGGYVTVERITDEIEELIDNGEIPLFQGWLKCLFWVL